MDFSFKATSDGSDGGGFSSIERALGRREDGFFRDLHFYRPTRPKHLQMQHETINPRVRISHARF